MSIYNWGTAGSGDWGGAADWQPAGVPGSADTATIAAAGIYAVTITQAESVAGLVVNAGGATVVVSASLSLGGLLAVQAGVLNLGSGGTISGGGIVATAGIVLFEGGTLSGVVVQGPADLTTVGQSVTIDAATRFTGADGAGPGTINLTGEDVALAVLGTGTLDNVVINLGGSLDYFNAALDAGAAAAGTTLTLGAGVTLQASGDSTLSQVNDATTIVNDGTIDVATAGSELTISPASFVNAGTIAVGFDAIALVTAASISNAAGGLITVGDGGTLALDGAWSNAGSIAVGAGGVLYLYGTFTTSQLAVIGDDGTIVLDGTLLNTGTLTIGPGGLLPALTLGAGGEIDGGAIVGNATGLALQGGTLSGVTWEGVADFGTGYASVSIANGTTFVGTGGVGPGTVELAGDEQYLLIDGSATLDDTTLLIGNDTFADDTVFLGVTGPGQTLTLGPALQLDDTASYLELTSYDYSATVVNEGTITADAAAGQLVIQPGSFTNDGTLLVRNGQTLLIASGGFTNGAGGVIRVGGGGMLSLAGTDLNDGTIDVAGGTLQLAGSFSNAGSLALSDATIVLGGSVSQAELLGYAAGGNTVALAGTLYNAGSTLAVGPNPDDTFATLPLLGGTILGGTLQADGGLTVTTGTLDGVSVQGAVTLVDADAALTFADATTLAGAGGSGPGTIDLSGSSNYLYVEGNGTLDNVFIAPSGTAADYAYIFAGAYGYGETLTLGPAVTIAAGQIALSLSGYDQGSIVNEGTILGGGGEILMNSAGFSNNGSILLAAGEQLVDSAGSFANAAGGLIDVGAGATLALQGAASNAGTIIVNGGTLQLGAGFTNTGQLLLSDASVELSGTVTASQLAAYAGNGDTLLLDGVLVNTGTTLAVGPGAPLAELDLLAAGTILGGVVRDLGGGLQFRSGTLSGVTFEGTALLDGPFAALAITNGSSFVGSGGSGQGTIVLSGADAELAVDGGTTLDNLLIESGGGADSYSRIDATYSAAGAALSFGAGFTLVAPSDIELGSDAAALFNNGTLLVGPGAQLYAVSQTFDNAGLIAASGGVVDFSNGLTNAATGTIDVESGGVLYAGSTTANAGLIRIVDSTLAIELDGSLAPTGTLLLSFATIELGGTVVPASLSGLVAPGNTVELTGTLLNAGNALVVGAGSALGTLTLQGGVIAGGTVEDGGGGLLFNGGTLSGVTYIGGLTMAAGGDLWIDPGTTVQAPGGGQGTIVLDGSDYLALYGLTALDALLLRTNGDSGFGSGAGYISIGQYGSVGSLALGAGFTLDAAAAFTDVEDLGSVTVINNGTWIADGGDLDVTVQGFVNQGRLVAARGGTFDLQVPVGGGSVLAGGSYEIDAGATLELSGGAAIGTLAADLTLRGPASVFAALPGATVAPLESSLTTVAAGAALRVLDGRGFAAANAIDDSGLIALGGGTFAAPAVTIGGVFEGFGTLSAAAGSVVDDGTLIAGSGDLRLMGGIIGAGAVVIGTGATLELGSEISQAITFAAAGADTLALDAPADAQGALVGLAAGDRLDFVGSAVSGAAINGTTLSVTIGATAYLYTLAGSVTGVVAQTGTDGAGGSYVTLAPLGAALAQLQLDAPGTIDFGRVRVGATASEALSVLNAATAPAAALDVTPTADDAATAAGTIALLAAGQTDAAAISVGIATEAAGVQTGYVVLQPDSDGAGGTTILPGQTVATLGTVYRLAEPLFVNLDALVVHPGTTQLALGLINAARADGYSEALTARAIGASGAIGNASGSTGPIAAGLENAGSLVLTLDQASPGVIAGLATVDLQSTGAGTDGAAPLDLGDQTIGVTVTIENYATAAIEKADGAGGTLSAVGGTLYTMDFGAVAFGAAPEAADFVILNAAADPGDTLDGTLAASSTPAFSLDTAVPGYDYALDPGEASDDIGVTLEPTTVGSFAETIYFSGTGYNASGIQPALPTETLVVTGTVTALQVSPPVITTPATLDGVQDVPTLLSLGIAETGAVAGEMFTLTVSDSSGLLSVIGSGVSGNDTNTLTISGSLADVNATLGSLTDTDPSVAGDQINARVVDSFGNVGTASVAVEVAPITPQIIGPTSLTIAQGASSPLGLSLAEPDIFIGNDVVATLTDPAGGLRATAVDGATVSIAAGGTLVTIIGTGQQVNAALQTASVTADGSPETGNAAPGVQADAENTGSSSTVSESVTDNNGHTINGSIAVTTPLTPQNAAVDYNELFTAVLAMDSYNQGPQAAVPNVGSQIGDATLGTISSDPAAGFFATSYQWNGQIVVSYRGTVLSGYTGLADILFGWTAGAGILTPQVADAISFYDTATGSPITSGTQANVVLTGHSLGGGLAGLVGALTGDTAQIYDSMPFGAAATLYFLDYNAAALTANAVTGVANFLAQLLDGGSAPFGSVPYLPLPNASNVTLHSVSGEILQGVRGLSPAAPFLAGYVNLLPAAQVGVAAAGAVALQYQASTTPALNAYPPSSSGLGTINQAVQLHSIALYILLDYAQQTQHTAWQTVGANLFNAYFNDSYGQALGLSNSAQMLSEIAYTVIASGTPPFGNTGVVALFHDGDALGNFYTLDVSPTLMADNVMNDLAGWAVEYAGLLATNQDTNDAHDEGVFNFNTAADALKADLSDSTWNSATITPQTIVGESDLITSLFSVVQNAPTMADDIVLGADDAGGGTEDLSDDIGTDLVFAGDGSITFITGTGTTDIVAGSGTVVAQVQQQGKRLVFVGGSGSGTVDASGMSQSETIEVQSGIGGGSILAVMGSAEILRLDQPYQFEGEISGFAVGNTIDVGTVNFVSSATLSDDNQIIVGSTGIELQLIGQDYSGDLLETLPDGVDGTDIIIATLAFSPIDPQIPPDQDSQDFTLTRFGDVSQAATVYVSTTDGTTVPGEDDNDGDFEPIEDQKVVFAAGSDTTDVTVTIFGDDSDEDPKTFGLKATDAPSDDANTLGTDTFTLLPQPQNPTAEALGCPHFTTFDGQEFDFQGAGEFVLTRSTLPGDTFQVQARIEPEGSVDSSVSIITQIAVAVGSQRVTFAASRPQVVWLDGAPAAISPTSPILTLAGGTVTEISENQYRVALDTGEVVTVAPFGDGMGLSIALGANQGAGSVQGFLGADDGTANTFELPDGTVLAQPLTQAQLYQTYADAWRVTDATSLLDYGAGQDTATFTNTTYPREILTLADLPSDLVAAAAAVVAAAGITDPVLAADAEFDYITMGDPNFITEDATLGALTGSAGTPATFTDAVPPPPSIGIIAASPTLTEAAGAVTPVSFVLNLTQATSADVLVDYAVMPGAGLNTGQVYLNAASFGGTLPSGTATIAAGATEATVTVDVPANAVGTLADEWLMVTITAEGSNVVYNPTAQTELLNSSPVAGPAAQPVIELLTTPQALALQTAPTLAQAGSVYTLDLGDVARGAALPEFQFAIANAATQGADALSFLFKTITGTGFSVSAGTPPPSLAGGSSFQTLYFIPDTGTLGAQSESLVLGEADINASGYDAALPNLTLTVTDTIVQAAAAAVYPTAIAFPDARIGSVLSQAVTIENTGFGPAGLDVTAIAGGAASVAGSITALAAQTVDATDIAAGLSTAAAGLQVGQVVLTLDSDQAGGVKLPILPSPTISIAGTIFQQASAAVAGGSVVLHVGDAGTATLVIRNTAPAGVFSEDLIAAIAGVSGPFTTASQAATGDILPGGTATGTLDLGFSTAQAGTLAGAVTLAAVSDGGIGPGSIDGLGTIGLAPVTTDLTAVIDNYATAAFEAISGGGRFSINGDAATLDLGTVALGAAAPSLVLGVVNAAAGPADALGGSFDISAGTAFTDAGFAAFGGLGAGQASSCRRSRCMRPAAMPAAMPARSIR
jgi:hypothetical protein